MTLASAIRHLDDITEKPIADPEPLAHLAEAYRRSGELQKALQLYWRAFGLWRRSQKGSRMCWCLWGVGATLRLAGRFSESKYWLRTARALSRANREARCELWSHAEIAEIDRIQGARRGALHEHFALLPEFQRIGDTKGIIWAYSGIAQIFRMEKQYSSALANFIRAHQLSIAVGDVVGAGWALRGQSEIAKELREYENASVFATLAAESFSKKGYQIGVAYTWKTLADIHVITGQVNQARELVLASVQAFSNMRVPRGLGFALKTFADTQYKLGEIQQASDSYRQSKSLLAHLRIANIGTFNPEAAAYHHRLPITFEPRVQRPFE